MRAAEAAEDMLEGAWLLAEASEWRARVEALGPEAARRVNPPSLRARLAALNKPFVSGVAGWGGRSWRCGLVRGLDGVSSTHELSGANPCSLPQVVPATVAKPAARARKEPHAWPGAQKKRKVRLLVVRCLPPDTAPNRSLPPPSMTARYAPLHSLPPMGPPTLAQGPR
jgi:hypothetical protein